MGVDFAAYLLRSLAEWGFQARPVLSTWGFSVLQGRKQFAPRSDQIWSALRLWTRKLYFLTAFSTQSVGLPARICSPVPPVDSLGHTRVVPVQLSQPIPQGVTMEEPPNFGCLANEDKRTFILEVGLSHSENQWRPLPCADYSFLKPCLWGGHSQVAVRWYLDSKVATGAVGSATSRSQGLLSRREKLKPGRKRGLPSHCFPYYSARALRPESSY